MSGFTQTSINNNILLNTQIKTHIRNLKNKINSLGANSIKSVIENDLKKNPIFKKKNDVQFYIFNEPSEEYREDFNILLSKYEKYYKFQNNVFQQKIQEYKNKNLNKKQIGLKMCNVEYEKQNIPPFHRLSQIDYCRRRKRDFNRHLTTESNNGLLNFFRKRIEHFENCKSELKKEYIPNELKENITLYTNEDVSSLTNEQKENMILKIYQNFFNKEKNNEIKIMTKYNNQIKSVQNNIKIPENKKNNTIHNLKSKQITELFNEFKFGPLNKNLDINLNKCKLTNINKNKQIKIYDFIEKYIIPQGKKVFLFGLLTYLRRFFGCTKLFYAAPSIFINNKNINKSIKNHLLFNEPITNQITTNSMCHKYILWTPYLNYFFIISSLKKSMNIPLIIYRPQNKYHTLPKYRDSLQNNDFSISVNGSDIKRKMKFIGVITIPYKKNTEEILYKYIFIFEHIKGRYFRNYMSSSATPFLLVDENKYLVSEGHILPQNVISYDEIAYLYYLSQEHDKKLVPFFYCDPEHPDFIIVSLKHNLDQIQPYINYGLKKVKLQSWYQIGKKQFIFKFENNNTPLPNSIERLKNNYHQSRYIMSTIHKRTNIEKD